jgi:hypothetical protein
MTAASVARDSVGRLRLQGSYESDDEVDRAFLIVQALVGRKATSPIYPQQVKFRRWEAAAAKALADYAHAAASRATPPPAKRALVIGISQFLDRAISPIHGEPDAIAMASLLRHHGYEVTALVGAAATRKAIHDAVDSLSRQLGLRDSLVVAVSSHGTPPTPAPGGDDRRRMSIMAYDTVQVNASTRGDPVLQRLSVHETSIRDSLIQELAFRPSRVARLLIDTCHSGAALSGLPEPSQRFLRETEQAASAPESASVATWSQQLASKGINFIGAGDAAAAQPATPAARELRPHCTIIAASGADEKSWGPASGRFVSPLNPGKTLQGSFFTQALVEHLWANGGRVQDAFVKARRYSQTMVAASKQSQVAQIRSSLQPAEDAFDRL